MSNLPEQWKNDIKELFQSTIQDYIFTPQKEVSSKDLTGNGKRVYTIKGAAEFTLMKPPTLRGYISQGKLAHITMGKNLLFFEEDLINFLKAHRKPTKQELANQAETIMLHSNQRA